MVGAFKVDEALPLLARYVGSLPSTGKRTARVQGPRRPVPGQGRRATRVEKGREPRSQTVISFFADPSPDAARTGARRSPRRRCSRPRCATRCARSSARPTRCRSACRSRCRSAATATSRCSFGAAPENITAMTDRVIQEVQRLQEKGPSADLDHRARRNRRGAATKRRCGRTPTGCGGCSTVHMLGRDPGEILTRTRAHRRGHAGGPAGGVQEVLPARSVHGGHADARAGRSSVRLQPDRLSGEVGHYEWSAKVAINGQ